MSTWASIRRDERGQAVVMGAVSTFALLAVFGLALDLGRLFVVRAELSKAVDAAALAGARVIFSGKQETEATALEFAQMNFGDGYMSTKSHDFTAAYSISSNKPTIAVQGTAVMPTTLMRLVGKDQVSVSAFAEAQRRPVSLAMVLDNSLSMDPAYVGTDAIGYLRSAAKTFVGLFDDRVDEMALALFSTGTEVRFPLNYNFKSPIQSAIQSMTAVAYTNLSDGLRGGYQELKRDQNAGSFRALVFFTDGQPTALRGLFLVGGVPVDAVIKGDPGPGGVVNNQLYAPDRLDSAKPGVFYTASTFPTGQSKTVANLETLANTNVLNDARKARSEGMTIYVIGLGNPNTSAAWKLPDCKLLMQVANVAGGVDPTTGKMFTNPTYDAAQPVGSFVFAPSAAELAGVFNEIAGHIAMRLTQ
jgi:Flp pilus assembly protein TadG